MKIGKQFKNKVRQTYGTTLIKEEITKKLGHSGWLKFSKTTQQEIEDKYLQYKNLGLC